MPLTPQHSTAILVFANSSQKDAENKAIPKSGLLFDKLTHHTLTTVEKTDFPYFHFTEAKQIGNSFGERFSNAIQSVFDAGFERVITIGNDTPQLRASHLLDASQCLEEGRSVLGPSADGGFYLLGLHKSRFNVSTFKKLPWQTTTLFKEISLLLDLKNDRPVRLQTLFDLDNVKDLELFYSRFRNIPDNLFEIIRSLLAVVGETFTFLSLLFENYLSKILYNKGSPSVLHS